LNRRTVPKYGSKCTGQVVSGSGASGAGGDGAGAEPKCTRQVTPGPARVRSACDPRPLGRALQCRVSRLSFSVSPTTHLHAIRPTDMARRIARYCRLPQRTPQLQDIISASESRLPNPLWPMPTSRAIGGFGRTWQSPSCAKRFRCMPERTWG
jgi:hypothetical protein